MKKLVTIAALSMMMVIAIGADGFAQGIRVEINGRIYCVVSCEGHVLVTAAIGLPDADGELVLGSGGGNAEFECVASTGEEEGEVSSSEFIPITLTISGTHATYGDFSFNYDASRPAPNTVVTANQYGSDFPATSVVQANVYGTVSGLPGYYVNSTPCRISTTNLMSFNPHINERYTFENDVVFVNADDPNAPVFIIRQGAEVRLN